MIPIPKELLQRCYEHGAQTYPDECCGVLSAPADDPARLTGFHPIANTLNRLHEQDPQRYPRTAREGYVLDALAFAKLERSLEEQGRKIRVVYHSHVDVGAYFSEEDKKQATWDGKPILPGLFYLVCGVKARNPDGAILAAFNEASGDFDEQKVD